TGSRAGDCPARGGSREPGRAVPGNKTERSLRPASSEQVRQRCIELTALLYGPTFVGVYRSSPGRGKFGHIRIRLHLYGDSFAAAAGARGADRLGRGAWSAAAAGG